MKRLHLFEAVGLVDERLVEEAADAKRTTQPWSKWLAAAACAALALSLGTAAAGTLLRGCGSMNSSASEKAAETATADMAAPADTAPAAAAEPAAEAVSEELSPEMEKDEDKQSGKEHQAAGTAVPETAQAEPEEPLPEPAVPQGFDGMSNDSMGGLQKVPELYAAAGEIVITLRETAEDEEMGIRRALYWVENQSGAERTEILHYTLCTGEEGMEGLDFEIRIDGETVPFNAYEATVCPAEDGTVPEPEERSYLIEFAATLSAKKRIEVEIQY